MLVLVPGVTGHVGQHLITSLKSRGHQVRGLGRDPSKLSSKLFNDLESFVESTSYYDIPALDKACQGVDAIIDAYSGLPELTLDGQLLLLRAAERAGIRIFVAASWNYDWRKIAFKQQDSYDPFISFHNHVELTSDIKPHYILSGVLAEVLFGAPGRFKLSPKNNGVWDGEEKLVEIWGDGKEKWHWTTEKDAAEFAAAILDTQDAENGEFWTVCSGAHTLEEIAKIYGQVRGCEVAIKRKGTVDELRKRAYEAKAKGQRNRFWEYMGYFYVLHTVDGSWTLGELDNKRLGVNGTSLEDFLRSEPNV